MNNLAIANLSRRKNFFENAWSAGLITLLSGVILALSARLHMPLELVLSLLMSVAATNIGMLLKRLIDNVIREQQNSRNAILERYQGQSERRADALEDPFLQMLAWQILRQTQGSIIELDRIQESLVLRTERDYTLYLGPRISHLGMGDRVCAFCTGKAWGNIEVAKYFEENLKALKRGCQITRVFLDAGISSDEQTKILEQQKREGATVLILPAERLSEFIMAHRLSRDMGFVLLDDEVLVHRGREGSSREVFVLKSEFAVAVFRRLFAELQQASSPYPCIKPADVCG